MFGGGTLLDFFNMTVARTDVLTREPTVKVVMDGFDSVIRVFEVTERLKTRDLAHEIKLGDDGWGRSVGSQN